MVLTAESGKPGAPLISFVLLIEKKKKTTSSTVQIRAVGIEALACTITWVKGQLG